MKAFTRVAINIKTCIANAVQIVVVTFLIELVTCCQLQLKEMIHLAVLAAIQPCRVLGNGGHYILRLYN